MGQRQQGASQQTTFSACRPARMLRQRRRSILLSSPGSSVSVPLLRSTHMLHSPRIISSSARPHLCKHGPPTVLDSRARRDQKGHPGGYAGVRLGEAQNQRPADHERHSAQEEPCPRRARISEAVDAVPQSQDSITRKVQNLQLADISAAQPDHAGRPSVTMPNSRSPTQCAASSSRSVGST